MNRPAAIATLLLLLLAASLAAEEKASATFELSIPSMLVVKFQEASGLGSESAVVEYREGTSEETRKIPGAKKYGDITLKRGLTADRSLALWRALIESGNLADATKNGAIIVYDKTGRAVARWSFSHGWPSKVSVDSDPETGVAIETLVLAVEGISRD